MSASPETTTRPAEERPRATAALILGILSIPAALIPILAVALAVIALVLGITARNDMRRNGRPGTGKATAAIICAGIGLALGLFVWVATAAAIISNNN
jgi:apolipoprotein N-acyltransferase